MELLNKVVQGDCLDLLPLVPSGSIDMILTDLPYGTTGIAWDIPIDLEKLWMQYERIIKPKGVIALSSQGLFTGKIIMSNPKLFKYKIVWVKSSPTNFLQAKKAPLRRHEDICIFYKEMPTYNPQMARGRIYVRGVKDGHVNDNYGELKAVGPTKSRERYPTDVVFHEESLITDSVYFKQAASEGASYHPTQKPLDLGRYLIRTYTNAGDIVLDSTCGSGSFLIAAVMEHRQFIGMEKNEMAVHQGEPVDYVAICNERIAAAYKWRADEDLKLSLF